MLHETILALLGIPGDIFKTNEEGVYFEICPKFLKRLHPSEAHFMQKICCIGGIYYYIQQLVYAFDTRESLGSDKQSLDQELIESVYMESFVYGLRAVMKNYCDVVETIEKEIISNEFMSLSLLVVKIEIVHFQIIKNMGGVILCWSNSCCLYGIILDQNKEFFIGEKVLHEQSVLYVREEIGPTFITRDYKSKVCKFHFKNTINSKNIEQTQGSKFDY
ncbi:Gamma-tubulin complex component 4 [Thelohanellus kitauei]|uniref:Gamma-tubulin complex component 4 n=1 Tax=Thelohanellus kitauei TaxID=669202 RepID=A0A0C2MLP0_THEKT|nr:Gamma-tubulin complex component 4 [Thelohanellus kitauei]